MQSPDRCIKRASGRAFCAVERSAATVDRQVWRAGMDVLGTGGLSLVGVRTLALLARRASGVATATGLLRLLLTTLDLDRGLRAALAEGTG